MKAMVLAAGLGTRMRPLSQLRAKAALPVLDRPLIHWTLERLAHAGIVDVVINLHHRPSSVVRAVGDGRSLGLRVTYSRERVLLGTGGGPRKVRRVFGDEPFLLVNGDVFFDFDLRELIQAQQRSRARVALGLLPNPDPRRYPPVVTDRTRRILSIGGRPRAERGRPWLFTGLHVLDPRLLERLPHGCSDSVHDLYVPLLREGEFLLGVPLRGAWYDLGAPSLYLASQRALLAQAVGKRGCLVHREALVDPGAAVQGSVLGKGCVVKKGARVLDSVLWENVTVGPGAAVLSSVVGDGVRIPASARVEGEVMTRATRATRTGLGRATGRLLSVEV